MENQHRLIKGYRDLEQADIDLINECKAMGMQVEQLVNKLRERGEKLGQRWISVGVIDLQKGFMGLVRGIARPGFF